MTFNGWESLGSFYEGLTLVPVCGLQFCIHPAVFGSSGICLFYIFALAYSRIINMGIALCVLQGT